MITWLLDMLRSVPEESLPRKVFDTALRLEFPEDIAARQLDTAINWGRYAELLVYDDRSERMSLDVPDEVGTPSAA